MPTDRRRDSLLLGSQPSAPRGYGGGSDITSLILEQGRQQADTARQQGDIWGNALQQVGGQISGAITQHAEEKKLAKRDAAWSSFLQDPTTWKDPKTAYAKTMSMWGPEKGPQMWQGLVGVMQLSGEKRNPEMDMKALGAASGAYLNSTPEGRKLQYPGLRTLAQRAAPEFGQAMPEQHDPAFDDNMVVPFAKQFAPPAKPGKFSPVTTAEGIKSFDEGTGEIGGVIGQPVPKDPKMYSQTVKGPGGGPVAQLFTEEQMAAGVPTYREPKAPAAPKEVKRMWVMRDGEPLRVSEADYRPGDLPASTRDQGRPVTSGDANRVAKLDTALGQLGRLENLIADNGATGARAKLGALVPDVITEVSGLGAESKSKQAAIDLVRQNIGKALEEGVLRKEDEEKYKKILPLISDPPSVVRAKFTQLKEALGSDRDSLFNSLEDAGYDVGRFRARQGDAPKPPAGGAGKKNPFR